MSDTPASDRDDTGSGFGSESTSAADTGAGVAGDGSDDEPNTLLNALVGGVTTVVTSFLPFSPLLGGALAGYLEGEDTGDGLRVGLYAGLVALIPLVLLFLLAGSALAVFGFGTMGPRGGAMGLFGAGLLFVGLVFGLFYTVGLSALGGYLGAYLHREMD